MARKCRHAPGTVIYADEFHVQNCPEIINERKIYRAPIRISVRVGNMKVTGRVIKYEAVVTVLRGAE